eukprot:1883047-Amphidinium_carterae.1
MEGHTPNPSTFHSSRSFESHDTCEVCSQCQQSQGRGSECVWRPTCDGRGRESKIPLQRAVGALLSIQDQSV